MENVNSMKNAMHKISWPSAKKTAKNTGLVLLFSVLMGGITFLSDFAAAGLVQLMLP